MAKLTVSSVQTIRSRRAKGEREVDLASEYGVDQATINNVVARRTWAHV